MWEELKEIFKCDQNFAALRAVNKGCSLPAIPYLGMFVIYKTKISLLYIFNIFFIGI